MIAQLTRGTALIRRHLRPLHIAGALAGAMLLVTVPAPPAAAHETRPQQAREVEVSRANHDLNAIAIRPAQQASSTLNLLSGPERRPVEQVRAVNYGRGAYICSPSGFGKKSSCHRR